MNIFFDHCIKCKRCLKFYDSSFFINVKIGLCLFCYENNFNRVQHKRRELLGLPSMKTDSTKVDRIQCPRCKSKTTRKARLSTKETNSMFCKNCNLIWKNLEST